MTKDAVIALPLCILSRWASSPIWTSRLPVQPKQSSGHWRQPCMLGLLITVIAIIAVLYMNGVCQRLKQVNVKLDGGLLGCHIQLTVSASPVSCNPLNTNLLSSILTFVWFVVQILSSSLYPKFIHTLCSCSQRVNEFQLLAYPPVIKYLLYQETANALTLLLDSHKPGEVFLSFEEPSGQLLCDFQLVAPHTAELQKKLKASCEIKIGEKFILKGQLFFL